MKKLTAIVALVMLLTTVLTPAVLAEDKKQFRVGMECNYPPFNWTQADPSDTAVEIEGGMGYADGYDVQIAKKIADALDMELVIVKTEWDGLPLAVQSEYIDAIIAGMSPTEERKVTMDFSDAYYTSDLVVVVKKDSPFANAKALSDLSGAMLVGQLNTFHETVIQQIPGVIQGLSMETFAAMVIATRTGAVDGYVAERPGAIADCAANPDLTYIVFDEGQGFTASVDDRSIAVGLKKGSPLAAQINDTLAQISKADREILMENAILNQPLAE